MGAKGIKRRKPQRRLPKVRAGDLPSENDLIPPHIMWPARGSGFEADPHSPAGQAQRTWWMLNSRRRRSRGFDLAVNVLAWMLLLLLAFALGSMAVDSLR